MQIQYLHKSIYKLYSYAHKQEVLDHYRDIYQKSVKLWEKLRKEGICIKTCQEFSGLSRATYYRHRKILANLEQDIHHTYAVAQTAPLMKSLHGIHSNLFITL